ncbi:hypothetical protein CORC01_07033 [Colletotrichum orchidophilum]|uniref:DUF7918 domain-containing protein n=1 Tax=Colletotrichum orchidophilum TaxID=1209926 RepID=A0A1G4B839_9PEZI|nr:uncharacterized protein CORC01_07033 [Colletotrichum orchidophilum]OHE97618.1 hypothetical protein CORC01_07033 [Colletotrichum orchidophilum]
MAVIDSLPEIKVSIRINGSHDDCIEFVDPDPPGVPSSSGSSNHTISKVIESQVDTKFSIHYQIQNSRGWIDGDNRLAVALYIDGNRIVARYHHKCHLVHQKIASFIRCVKDKSGKPGKVILRQFKFAPINTVEGSTERLAADELIAQKVGIIEVIVYCVEFKGFKPSGVRDSREVKEPEKIAEKALKGKSLSHGTSFSEGIEKDASASTARKSYSFPDGSKRIARFFFRYKPKTSLQVDGIIPRDPSPELSPSSLPQTVAMLPLAEIHKLAQERLEQLQQKTKQENRAGVKREADEEADFQLRKIYKMDADGTIDLVDD